MPEVKQIRPQGIVVTIDFPLEEVRKMRDMLDHCEIHVDLKNPDEVELDRYTRLQLYPLLDKVVKDLDHGS